MDKLIDNILVKCIIDPIAIIVDGKYFYTTLHYFLWFNIFVTLTLDVVNSINEYMSSLNIFEDNNIYLNFDSICKSNTNINLLTGLHTS